MAKYVLSIDQSTQGTKALLFDKNGILLCRTDLSHRQIINDKGWVEHDPEEIYNNTLQVIKNLVEKAGINKDEIQVLGISNQRETVVVWDKITGKPLYNAIVWQCARGASICEEISEHTEKIHSKTGLKLSPYFSAAKIAWVMRNVPEAREKAQKGELCCGTIDSWLVFKLTSGKEFRTDYSNASRTQLFNISELVWDNEICEWFGIPVNSLAKVTDSDGFFGKTDFDGYLNNQIEIHAVLGDSHGALFGQGCLNQGMIKVTYGTGSSIMMNIGENPIHSNQVVTSLAWKIQGKVNYVLEGNINYTGAVISWLKDNLQIINSPSETEDFIAIANPNDTTYLVPAFSGLGAPYWNSNVKAIISGMTRTTGKAEIIKAAVESIAYQITDIISVMSDETGVNISELRVDGGATKNKYLMQFQSDIAQIPVNIPEVEELSGIGVAFAAGISTGIYNIETLFSSQNYTVCQPKMCKDKVFEKYNGWKNTLYKIT